MPFPADKLKVPVVIDVTNVSVSKEDETIRLYIINTEDYDLGQQYILEVVVTNKNCKPYKYQMQAKNYVLPLGTPCSTDIQILKCRRYSGP